VLQCDTFFGLRASGTRIREGKVERERVRLGKGKEKKNLALTPLGK